MSDHAFVETTKITSKGQATIPKSVREIIGVEPGDKISFVVRNETVEIVSASEFVLNPKERTDGNK
jgi:AbrB family looped-hinge helix DNA binding protein